MDRQEGKEKENEGGNKEHKEGREKGPEQEQDHEHNVRKEKGRELTQEEQDEQDTWDKEQEDRKKTVDKACTEWKYLGVATVSFGQEGGGEENYCVENMVGYIGFQRQGKGYRRSFLYSPKHTLLYCRNAKVT